MMCANHNRDTEELESPPLPIELVKQYIEFTEVYGNEITFKEWKNKFYKNG